jgi:endonuclease YncB( thermonuclease family)
MGKSGDSRCGVALGEEANRDAELTVLLLEFVDSTFEEGELGLAAVTRVLSGDTVAVRTGLLALLRGDL